MARIQKSGSTGGLTKRPGRGRLYTLSVGLVSGPVRKAVALKNPVITRTIQIRGDQTLQDLHRAIFDAFDRREEHLYEFQFGLGPMDPEGPRYVLHDVGEGGAAGLVTETTIDSLGLEAGRRFGYWFDFGDDWWHQVDVEKVEDKVPRGKYPKVTKRVGQSPPQYADENSQGGEEGADPEISPAAAADAACLVGELHLGKGEYEKAVDAFSRAIDGNPTVDAYEGRAKAYRALADQDEQKVQEERNRQ